MPLREFACLNGHIEEQYLPRAGSFPLLRDCVTCGEYLHLPVLSFGRALTYFRENNAQTIMNLDPSQPIRSHEHHKRVMKEKGLEPLTDWHTSKRRSV